MDIWELTALYYLMFDIFSLYVLFSHFRLRDITLENTFFQILSSVRAYIRITYEKTKEKFPWSEIGKQNVQTKTGLLCHPRRPRERLWGRGKSKQHFV